jgi:hypothetical protein
LDARGGVDQDNYLKLVAISNCHRVGIELLGEADGRSALYSPGALFARRFAGVRGSGQEAGHPHPARRCRSAYGGRVLCPGRRQPAARRDVRAAGAALCRRRPGGSGSCGEAAGGRVREASSRVSAWGHSSTALSTSRSPATTSAAGPRWIPDPVAAQRTSSSPTPRRRGESAPRAGRKRHAEGREGAFRVGLWHPRSVRISALTARGCRRRCAATGPARCGPASEGLGAGNARLG